MYLGDFRVNSVVRYLWNSNGSSGQSITRATNGTIRIYKNNSTTERSSSNGITDTEDFDSLTGVHHTNVDTSDNTDSGFYAAGNDYFAVLAAATIDGQTVNHHLFSWSIENRSALMPTTADRRLTVESDGMAHADCKEWLGGTIATPTQTGVPEVDPTHWLGSALATPTVAGVPEVDATHVAGSTTDVSTMPASIAAILVDTGTTLDGRIPAALVGGRMDATVDGTGMEAGAVTAIVAGVWGALRADHLIANSFGGSFTDLILLMDDLSGYITGTAGAVLSGTHGNAAMKTLLDAIVADTNEIQTDLANGGRLDLLIDGIKAKTDSLTFTAASKVDATLNAATDLAAAVGNRIADHVLRRSSASARASSYGDTVAFRSLLGAASKLTNKIAVSGGNLLIYEEDDTTTFGTQAITSDASADPMTALDTA